MASSEADEAPQRSLETEPSWDVLEDLATGVGLTPVGGEAVRSGFQVLRESLGRSWPRRQFAERGWIPDELMMCGLHAAALPLFLAFVTRLREATGELTFASVLAGVRRGVDASSWRHLLLQLETARAGRDIGMHATFEPPVPGGANVADVQLLHSDLPAMLVETTTLFVSDADKAWADRERRLSWSIMEIEQRHGVFAVTDVTGSLTESDVENALVTVDLAAREARRTGIVQQVDVGFVRVVVSTTSPDRMTTTFSGAAHTSDGWRRLAAKLVKKSRQSAGPAPVWLRVDAVDGFFQFTDWHTLPWDDRVRRLASALRATLGAAPHVAGVVLTSGPAVCLGAVDLSLENSSVQVDDVGAGLRRLIAPHLARETAIVPLNDEGRLTAGLWYDAYDSEPSWLDEDLHALGLPQLSACWVSADSHVRLT